MCLQVKKIMHRKYISIFLVALLVPLGSAVAADKVIPAEATELIRRVHDAAAKRNFEALKNSMVDEFVWSFGGDGDATQALKAWNTDPRYLRQLSRVTASSCVIRTDLVECPVNAGVGYRAGFKRTNSGWRMIYFVAGD